MKAKIIIFIFILIACSEWVYAQKLQKIWETTCELKIPESVLYDIENNIIYVSNINGNPTEKDGNGFISRLDINGNVIDLKWIVKLDAPKGMAVFDGKLYVSDIDKLVVIDILKGKIENKYEAKNAVFLNDVAVCQNGMVFVSDSGAKKIFVLYRGEFKVLTEGEPFNSPNGLLTDMGRLLIGDNNIYEFDILTHNIQTRVEKTGGVDGLVKKENGDLIYSNWEGRIFLYSNGESTILLETAEMKINSADIGFIESENMVLVPTFFNNKVVAYKLPD